MKPRQRFQLKAAGKSRKTVRNGISAITVTLPETKKEVPGIHTTSLRDKSLRFLTKEIEIKDGFGTRMRLVRQGKRTAKALPPGIVQLTAPVPVKLHGISRVKPSIRGIGGIKRLEGVGGHFSIDGAGGTPDVFMVPDTGQGKPAPNKMSAKELIRASRKASKPKAAVTPRGGDPPTLPEPDIEMLRDSLKGTPANALRQLVALYIQTALKGTKDEAEHNYRLINEINIELDHPFDDLILAFGDEINRLAKDITIYVKGDYVGQKIQNENQGSNVFNGSVNQPRFLTQEDEGKENPPT